VDGVVAVKAVLKKWRICAFFEKISRTGDTFWGVGCFIYVILIENHCGTL
jgi:hypothetical protein